MLTIIVKMFEEHLLRILRKTWFATKTLCVTACSVVTNQVIPRVLKEEISTNQCLLWQKLCWPIFEAPISKKGAGKVHVLRNYLERSTTRSAYVTSVYSRLAFYLGISLLLNEFRCDSRFITRVSIMVVMYQSIPDLTIPRPGQNPGAIFWWADSPPPGERKEFKTPTPPGQ